MCLGDAVHRHPPMNGLGSNTCIQDAFNLAWKVAYVHRGLADKSLLETYSVERQPIGKAIIKRANQAFRDHFNVWEALGTLPKELSERKAVLEDMASNTTKGETRFREAIKSTSHESHALGIEMGQRYSGQGVYTADEPQPYTLSGSAAEDSILFYEPSTYPGCRLPHVWLNKAIPGTPKSIIDLAGHGAFTLFINGPGGQMWKDAAESGVVLVRPDRFVAWRASRALPSSNECKTKLEKVMQFVLGLAPYTNGY